MRTRLHKAHDERDQGFTLIELLVVVIIIGILAAIAIPVFLNQRKKGVDASIKSDLKNAATAAETLATDAPSSDGVAGTPYYVGTASTGNVAQAGFKKSPNNTIEIAGGPASGYCIRGQNAGGTATGTLYFWYDSQAGGLASGAATATAPAGACASATVTSKGGWVTLN